MKKNSGTTCEPRWTSRAISTWLNDVRKIHNKSWCVTAITLTTHLGSSDQFFLVTFFSLSFMHSLGDQTLRPKVGSQELYIKSIRSEQQRKFYFKYAATSHCGWILKKALSNCHPNLLMDKQPFVNGRVASPKSIAGDTTASNNFSRKTKATRLFNRMICLKLFFKFAPSNLQTMGRFQISPG